MSWLRRATNYSSGISAGGGETSFDKQPQPTLLTKIIRSSAQDVILPKGTIITDVVYIPDADNPAAAGTIKVDNVTDSTVVQAATSATAYSKTATGPTRITADKRYRFTPVVALTNGSQCAVGFMVILPSTHR